MRKTKKGFVYSYLPGLVLKLGIVIFTASLILSGHLRKTEDAILIEGDTSPIEGKSVVVLGEGITLLNLKSGIPDEFMEIGESSSFRLKNISAIISTEAKSIEIDSGFPARDGAKYYRISGIGFSQVLTIKAREEVEKSLAANLDILPPGKTAKIALESGDTLSVRLEPGKVIKKGLLTGRLYNLKNPLYRAALLDRAGKTIGEATIRPGERARLANSELSLGAQSVFLKINAVQDPALMFVYLGVVLALLGLTLMPLRFALRPVSAVDETKSPGNKKESPDKRP